MPLDLHAGHLGIVREILQRYAPHLEVWAFGSRVRGMAHPSSDLDLCILNKEPLAFNRLSQLRDAFSISTLPFRVDVVDWATTSESFRRIIEREKVVVQREGQISSNRETDSEWPG
ncbi:MAG: nucleotidyltransferase domain-containing protein [Magnetococcus sp. YQC-9]